MVVQSLSIAVPAGCPNKCKFCVAQMHEGTYANQIEKNLPFRDLYKRDYYDRLAFARDNGCNSLIFTGNGEALMNKSFMEMVADLNERLDKPFRNLELQTSGVTLDEDTLRFLRNSIKISTISLSLSSIWDNDKNQEYCGTPDKLKVDIDGLCELIKKYDFNLRLSLNMTDDFDRDSYVRYADSQGMENTIAYENVKVLFMRAKELGADQLTFRKLYTSDADTPENAWVKEHAVCEGFWDVLSYFIKEDGRPLERLPYGAMRYSVNEMSVVADTDSMSTTAKDEIKYLVLRPNCKLYTQWNSKGSLLF